jgi:hypothetical protein
VSCVHYRVYCDGTVCTFAGASGLKSCSKN